MSTSFVTYNLQEKKEVYLSHSLPIFHWVLFIFFKYCAFGLKHMIYSINIHFKDLKFIFLEVINLRIAVENSSTTSRNSYYCEQLPRGHAC